MSEQDVEEFAASAPKPRKGKKRIDATSILERACEQLDEMKQAYRKNPNAFDDIEPRHLVALYFQLHEHVYGVAPAELRDGQQYLGAVSAAKKLLKQEFDEDPLSMVEFLRWCWQRERRAEKWRRKNDRETRRIGWRLQFVARNLVTDYRVALARKQKV